MNRVETSLFTAELSSTAFKWGVIQFPGTWSEKDNDYQLKLLDQKSEIIYSSPYNRASSFDPDKYDALVLPGGFSYGDYLRCGALAAREPIMNKIRRFGDEGKPIIGICNGFQILCEANLLEGRLRRNTDDKFHCQEVFMRVEKNDTIFTSEYKVHEVLRLPISHGEGRFVMGSKKDLKQLEDRRRVVFRYCSADGEITSESNPNGSWNNIAGITNERGNILGMMPHPERACDPQINFGGLDGNGIIISIVSHLRNS